MLCTKKNQTVGLDLVYNKNNTYTYIAPFPEMNQIKGALQNMKRTKTTLHKKFRPTQYKNIELSKKITCIKNENVKLK